MDMRSAKREGTAVPFPPVKRRKYNGKLTIQHVLAIAFSRAQANVCFPPRCAIVIIYFPTSLSSRASPRYKEERESRSDSNWKGKRLVLFSRQF